MKIRKVLVLLVLQLLLAISFGIILLTIAYAIPTDRIEINVRKSALETIEAEGLYPELTHMATSYLDNWTDSIMLANAAHSGKSSPLIDAMQNPRFVADEFPDQSLIKWAKTGGYDYESYYPQYWHGYLVLLKPLLVFMSLHEIRVLNGVCQISLVMLVSILLWKCNRTSIILPWIISYAFLMPIALAKCLQFSSCFYVFTLASIAVLRHKNKVEPFFVFLWAGIATAFFDFLTYPISTFGIPAVFFLLVKPEMENKKTIKILALCFLFWATGYGLMWGGKLLAGSLITGTNLIRASGSHVGQWFDGERWFSIGYVLYFNVRDFIYTPVSFAAMIFVFYTVIKLVKEHKLNRNNLISNVPFLAVIFLPFAWYLFLFNPSGIHHFFTNKACVVSAFGGMSMLEHMLTD